MFGAAVFKYTDTLYFSPEPILSADFFSEGRVRTTLLSDIEFIIENNTLLPTYSEKVGVDHFVVDGERYGCIKGDMAYKVRNRQVKQVIMVYKKI